MRDDEPVTMTPDSKAIDASTDRTGPVHTGSDQMGPDRVNGDGARAGGAPAPSRVRFQSIVEADIMEDSGEKAPAAAQGQSAPPLTATGAGAELAAAQEAATPLQPLSAPHRNWNALSRQVWQTTSWGAIFLFFFMAIGWPVGAFWAHLDLYGASNGWLAAFFSFDWLRTFFSFFGPEHALVTVFVPALIFLCGYILSHAFKMLHAAQFIASAAQQFIQPDKSAVYNAESVGLAVRGQMEALNTGVDGALQSLAAVEAMIRNHVTAIEHAGAAIEQRASGAVGKVAEERSRLIELTENLNAQADAFATAIAERAQAGVVAMGEASDLSARAETDLDERLSRLEAAASKALTSFQSLNDAVKGADNTFQASASALEASAERTRAAAADAATAAGGAQETGDTLAALSKDALDKAAQSAAAAGDAAREAQESARAAAETTAQTADEIKSAAGALQESADAAAASADGAALKARETIEARNKALSEARAALEKENARLESLIEEQRQRADRLADAIAAQTERLAGLSKAQADAAENLAATPAPLLFASPERGGAREADVLSLKGGAARRPAALPREQRAPGPDTDRLEELARDIAERRPASKTTPPSGEAPAPRAPKSAQRQQARKPAPKAKGDVSWREILDAADDGEPLDLKTAAKAAPQTTRGPGAPASDKPAAQQRAESAEGAAPRKDIARASASNSDSDDADADADKAIRIVHELQDFSRNLETRLYGEPPPALVERFERGDRNVFANRILRLNENDVKRRIRSESARDKEFERAIHKFLQGFESLLEDATTSDTADEELEEYLSSPLGRVYLLIGATVGYFA